MATYSNLGVKLITTGNEPGIWGTSTNDNFSLFDATIVGYANITLTGPGTTGSPNSLLITDGTLTGPNDPRKRVIEFTGSPGAASYVRVDPNDFVGYWFIRNSLSGGHSIFLFQGNYDAARDYEIPNGTDVVVRCTGGGTVSIVSNLLENLRVSQLSVTGNLDLNNFKIINLAIPTLASDAATKAYVESWATAGSNNLGYLNIPQNSQSGAYTLIASDAGKHILHPSADTTARIWTIPANASVAFPIGTAITFVNQNGAGTITISITTDVMRLAGTGGLGNRTLAANGIATALKITATEWIISGTGLT